MAKKILIAEDEAHMRRFLLVILKKTPYEALTAEDGRKAVEIAQRECPDLIVMDLNMPVMNGLEATEALKKDSRTESIPVIMLTGDGHYLTQESAEEIGVAGFLTKPFSPTKLIQEVKNVLDG